MNPYQVNLSKEQLVVLDFIVEDDSTSDHDLVNYYNQLIKSDIPLETLEENLCQELIGTFPKAIASANSLDQKKKIFLQYYKLLAVSAAYKKLIYKVGSLL